MESDTFTGSSNTMATEHAEVIPPLADCTEQAYRVLIVDDDEDARVLLERALRKAPLIFEVEAAADGVEALELVESFRPQIIITDVMMPRMDGFEFCTALRTNPSTATIPLMIVTALENDEDKERGYAVGADDYLTKPISCLDLAERLQRLLKTPPSSARYA